MSTLVHLLELFMTNRIKDYGNEFTLYRIQSVSKLFAFAKKDFFVKKSIDNANFAV